VGGCKICPLHGDPTHPLPAPFSIAPFCVLVVWHPPFFLTRRWSTHLSPELFFPFFSSTSPPGRRAQRTGNYSSGKAPLPYFFFFFPPFCYSPGQFDGSSFAICMRPLFPYLDPRRQLAMFFFWPSFPR